MLFLLLVAGRDMFEKVPVQIFPRHATSSISNDRKKVDIFNRRETKERMPWPTRLDRMAIIHRATLRPSKLELIEKYLPQQAWFTKDDSAQPGLLGAYRFDDPDGEVGLETHLVSHGGKVYQVPLSYRGSELSVAEGSLLGTMQHSVLGKRWVYDACADPVYVTALATTILTGQREAEQFVEVDGALEPRTSSVKVKGSGTPGSKVPALSPAAPITKDGVTSIDAGELTLLINRVLEVGAQGAEDSALRGSGALSVTGILSGTWADQTSPVLLASLTAVTG
jgi:hypothetical protein